MTTVVVTREKKEKKRSRAKGPQQKGERTNVNEGKETKTGRLFHASYGKEGGKRKNLAVEGQGG